MIAEGLGRGDLVAVATTHDVVAVVTSATSVTVARTALSDVAGRLEHTASPRWVVWSQATSAALVAAGTRPAMAWDVAAVHRLLFGGWRADPPLVWARLHELDPATIPAAGPVDLFTHADRDEGDPDDPVRADGHLRPDWVDGGWGSTPDRVARWAGLALRAAELQATRLTALADRPAAPATARSESAAEVLCAELAADGLPVDRAEAEAIIASFVGPRPRSEAEAHDLRAQRDDLVLRHAPPTAAHLDLRSPGQVMALLRQIGLDLPDTRAWRLERVRDEHPLVDALLTWRKAERVATTYGYDWLDAHVGRDGRLRGEWTGSDGAAGRMTASAGLHNLPADLRPAVVAEPGHVFVRADLGQIEPRVLAVVSGDGRLAAAATEDDMYQPVADQLDVDRATAKVAVLGAMYGQTTGHGAQALRRLHDAYPVAMAYLDAADRAGQAGRDLRTYGGRLIRLRADADRDLHPREARARAAGRGRYARNAMVQGAAAELFKAWAATVRARGTSIDARIVLCLHDELLVHVPEEAAEEAAALVVSCLDEAGRRWAPAGSAVKLVADVAVVRRWSDAKG